MNLLWANFKIIGPIAMTVMGIVVSLWKPKSDGQTRLLWVAMFVVVGGLTAYSSIQATRIEKAELVELITGGDNYCFIRADASDLKNHAENVRLWIEATGNLYEVAYWMFPASSRRDPNDPRYWSFDKPRPPMSIVYKGAVLLGRAIPQGRYMIEFSAKNEAFLQSFSIVEFNGELIQLIEVVKMKTGEPVYRSPRPAGYIG